MKLKIERKRLQELLDKVYPIVPVKSTMPVLSSILVEVKDGNIYLSATDLECSITTKGEAEVIEEGAVALSGKELYGIVKELPDSTIGFEVAELVTTIKCGKGRYALPGIAKDEFPQLLTVSGGTKTNLPLEVLKRGIDKTLFAASTTDPSSALRNCLLDLHKQECRFVATDGHKLAIFKSKFKTDQTTQLLISPKVWKELSNFSSEIEMTFDESKIKFSDDNTILVSRLQEGGFPPYESVIPADNDKELIISKEELFAGIKRAMVFSPDISRLLKFKISSGQVVIESASETGEGHEEIKCKYKGQAIEIGYNAYYLMGILSKIESDEVRFLLGSSETAGIITSKEKEKDKEKELTYLLMPIRLS